MKIYFHEYKLSQRKGALLKIDFRDGLTGYADCHPWPELGDLPLEQQLARLGRGQATSLTRQSLKLAEIDAEGRAAGKNLLSPLTIPKSHYLLLNLGVSSKMEVEQALEEGFTHFKVKVGTDFSDEMHFLEPLLEIPNAFWRLDFNNRLKVDDLPLLEAANVSSIEFIEDPFPYDSSWSEFPFPIALDRQADGHEDFYRYKVFKPSVEDFKETRKPLVVTSNLGHPLGQAADAYIAGKLNDDYNVGICGLLSHRVYSRNLFSEQLSWRGAEWKSPEGTGFGFDELLHTTTWCRL
jgi:o-succinylbenzoate synthase